MYLLFILLLIIIFNLGIVFFKKFAFKYNFISVPKKRDSHSGIIPKGSGIIFFLILMGYSLFQYSYLSNENILFLMIIICTPVIALSSFIDDKYNLSWRFKILIDISTSFLILYFIYNNFWGDNIVYNLICSFVILFFIIWFINLINFTDGSDGYLTSILITSTLTNIIAKYYLNYHLNFINIILLSMLINFLFYNLHPSNIFLGDAGSRFLSIILIIFIYIDYLDSKYLLLTVWFLSLMLILLDTSYTLILRFITVKNWMSEHKDHAYQILTQNYGHNSSLIWQILNTLFLVIPLIIIIILNKINILIALIIILILFMSQIIFIKHYLKRNE